MKEKKIVRDVEGAVNFLVKSNPEKYSKIKVGLDKNVVVEKDEAENIIQVFDGNTGNIVYFESNIKIH